MTIRVTSPTAVLGEAGRRRPRGCSRPARALPLALAHPMLLQGKVPTPPRKTRSPRSSAPRSAHPLPLPSRRARKEPASAFSTALPRSGLGLHARGLHPHAHPRDPVDHDPAAVAGRPGQPRGSRSRREVDHGEGGADGRDVRTLCANILCLRGRRNPRGIQLGVQQPVNLAGNPADQHGPCVGLAVLSAMPGAVDGCSLSTRLATWQVGYPFATDWRLRTTTCSSPLTCSTLSM